MRKLPQPEDHEKPLSPKTWSVKKWKRRSSPSKTIESPSPGAMGATSAGDAPVVEEKAMLAEGTLLHVIYVKYIYIYIFVYVFHLN